MLHIINKSSFTSDAFASCLRIIDDNSAIIFIEDGVICATIINTELNNIGKQGRLYALEEDLRARGLQAKITNNTKPVNYEKFVDLVVDYGTTISWF